MLMRGIDLGYTRAGDLFDGGRTAAFRTGEPGLQPEPFRAHPHHPAPGRETGTPPFRARQPHRDPVDLQAGLVEQGIERGGGGPPARVEGGKERRYLRDATEAAGVFIEEGGVIVELVEEERRGAVG